MSRAKRKRRAREDREAEVESQNSEDRADPTNESPSHSSEAHHTHTEVVEQPTANEELTPDAPANPVESSGETSTVVTDTDLPKAFGSSKKAQAKTRKQVKEKRTSTPAEQEPDPEKPQDVKKMKKMQVWKRMKAWRLRAVRAEMYVRECLSRLPAPNNIDLTPLTKAQRKRAKKWKTDVREQGSLIC